MRLVWLLLLVAVVTVGWTAFPVFTNYFRLRRASLVLANRCLQPGTNYEVEIEKFIDYAQDDLDTTIPRGAIDFSVDGNNVVEISVSADIPYSFPFVDETHYHEVVLEAMAEPLGDY